jgi:hypothetical protein
LVVGVYLDCTCKTVFIEGKTSANSSLKFVFLWYWAVTHQVSRGKQKIASVSKHENNLWSGFRGGKSFVPNTKVVASRTHHMKIMFTMPN